MTPPAARADSNSDAGTAGNPGRDAEVASPATTDGDAGGDWQRLNLAEWSYPERRKRGSTTGSRARARSMKASAVMTIRMPGGSTHHQ